MADGLRFLHSQVPIIVHGDVNGVSSVPISRQLSLQRSIQRNVAINGRGEAVLRNFGLWSLLVEGQPSRHQLPVSFPWASNPFSSVRPSAESDVYSFGMLVFHIYCNTQPMEGQYPGAIQVLSAILAGQRPKRQEVTRLDFTEHTWNIVQSFWAHEKEKRLEITAWHL